MGISVRDFLIELIEEIHPKCGCIILWAGLHFEIWVQGNSSFVKSLLLRCFHSRRNKVKASKQKQNKIKKKTWFKESISKKKKKSLFLFWWVTLENGGYWVWTGKASNGGTGLHSGKFTGWRGPKETPKHTRLMLEQTVTLWKLRVP